MAKKVILYGSADCPHCVQLKELMDKDEIRYGYVNVLAGLGHLKKFLNLRDQNPEIFKDVVANGKVGIPAVVVDDADVYIGKAEDFNLELFK